MVVGTMIYNLLDFPACSIPVTRQNEVDQIDLENYPDDDLIHSLVKKVSPTNPLNHRRGSYLRSINPSKTAYKWSVNNTFFVACQWQCLIYTYFREKLHTSPYLGVSVRQKLNPNSQFSSRRGEYNLLTELPQHSISVQQSEALLHLLAILVL